MAVQTFLDPWIHTTDGRILTCDGKTLFTMACKPNFNSPEQIALRAVTCVNAVRTLSNDTLKRVKFIIKPSKDHVILAAEIDDLVEWCKSIVEQAGYEVKEKA